MSYKKGQLSIETMIIYGLVILVALSVIGGLLYFNIIDLGSYLPDKCDVGGSGDLKCEEMKFVASGAPTIELGIRNIGQKPIELLTVTIQDNSGVHFPGEKLSTSTVYNTNNVCPITDDPDCVSLPPGEIAKVVIPTTTALPGKLLRGTLQTQYKYKDGAITQESTGSLRVKAS